MLIVRNFVSILTDYRLSDFILRKRYEDENKSICNSNSIKLHNQQKENVMYHFEFIFKQIFVIVILSKANNY